ncbi:putative oxidoreductase [Plectosphaerella plurivora]|uniref:Oxidoreductase n=1 Tax=Plectosphaerella plurivora TaxID=936078 RepID=A0A9P8V4G2_9PEZI|nr:putative oxidoreductase [Plectosphaerella plurivora]
MRAWMHLSPKLPLEKSMTLVRDAPLPAAPLKPTQLLIKVRTVGVNPADPIFSELPWPTRAMVKPSPISGMDYSGEVVSVGSDVTTLRPGDRVFGRVDTQKGMPGSMAEYTTANIDGCVLLPPNVDWDEAAGVGTAGVTAYQTVVPNAKAGDSIFINGGTGGVGTFAIQFAKAKGCKVTVSCSTAKMDLCKQLGADEVIDYRSEDLLTALRRRGKDSFDLVLDYAYRAETGLYAASSAFLKDTGKFVMVPGGVSLSTVMTIGKFTFCPSMLGGGRAKFEAYFAASNRPAFEQIAQWMAEGKVRTVVDSRLEFDEMPRAIERIKAGSATGKILVRV